MMIDPVSLYMIGGSLTSENGLGEIKAPQLDQERRRQHSGRQSTQQEDEQNNGVIVTISEEARSQARMSQTRIQDADGVEENASQLQNQAEDSVNEAPTYQREDGQDGNSNLVLAEAQYQSAGMIAMVNQSFLGRRENAAEEDNSQQNIEAIEVDGNLSFVGRNNDAAAPETDKAAERILQSRPGGLSEVTNEKAGRINGEEQSQNNDNWRAGFASGIPFSLISQTYNMSGRTEPYLSSFLLGV